MGKEGRYGIINRPLAKRLILNYLVVIHDQSFLSFCLHSIFFIKKMKGLSQRWCVKMREGVGTAAMAEALQSGAR